MKKSRTFASAIEKQPLKLRNAQMAESVDALVSNTSGFTSIPVRPRVWVLKQRKFERLSPFLFVSIVVFLTLKLFLPTYLHSLHFR